MNHTTWNLYTTNPEAWEAMLKACERAQKTIDMEQFLFTADEIGNRFIEVCARKAIEGVKVRFLWDAAGSFSFFGSSILEDLKKKGIELIFFKTLLPRFFKMHDYRSWYFRNHRRTLVVDNKVGFTGSGCVSKRTQNWRDTHVRVEGPVVTDMQKSFERMWNRAHGKRVPQIHHGGSDYEFEYVTNKPITRHHFLYNRIIEAVRNSTKFIYISVPYFIPTHRLSSALRLAAHRGVEVKIIIPGQSDHPIVDLGARTFFHSMLKSGIQIYLYRGKMLHSKTIVIDADWASVGTLNLDHISLLHNFEANLITTNSHFADELVSHFIHDIKNSEEVVFEEWKNRLFVEKIATFFVKFFRMFL